MKLLRNPVVVVVLAVLAAAIVLHALWPVLSRTLMPRHPAVTPVAQAKAPAIPGPAPAATNATPAATKPGQPLAGASLPRWAEAPHRDPFHSPDVSSQPGGGGTNSAAAKLVLSSILQQTGNSVAVLNGRVVGEGDTAEGFLVDKIEASQVWVSGPNGREAVGFKSEVSSPAGGRQDGSARADSHASAP
jgi:hypothetical protein